MKNYFFLFCIMLILFGTYTGPHDAVASTKGIRLVSLW